jgi:hypothetical protein
MVRALDALDLHLFHAVYNRGATTLERMCDSYVRHVGFRKIHILKVVRERMLARNGGAPLFDPHGRLLPEFIPERLGTHKDVYGTNLESSAPFVTLLPKSPNEFFDPTFPQALRYCFDRKTREALKLYTVLGAQLYCDGSVYQVYDKRSDSVWATADPFSLSRSIQRAPVTEFDGALYFIGDIFGGSNFAHFLFDYATRIGHLFESGVLDSHRDRGTPFALVLSGIPGPFHDLVLAALSEAYPLGPEQIIFQRSAATYAPSHSVSWFSDSYEHNQHPSQLMHPRSLAILTKIRRHVRVEASDAKRIYISRADAGQRRIANEGELIERLAREGFRVVTLSQLPIDAQISLIRGAEIIVAPHGMGLTHCAFHPGPLTLLELFSPSIGIDDYAALARASGFEYGFIVGTAIEGGDDFDISLGELESSLNLLLEGHRP